MFFVSHGVIDIGYEINRQRKFVLRFKHNVVIGSYNCTFNQRCIFVYRAKTECKGYFIRKQHWVDILNSNEELSDFIKKNVKSIYLSTIKEKVMQAKAAHITRIQKREDLKHLLVISEKKPKDLESRTMLRNQETPKPENGPNAFKEQSTDYHTKLKKVTERITGLMEQVDELTELTETQEAEIQRLKDEIHK